MAWCNQTSYWSDKGYNISHSQYLKGDFSLTITAAEYSMRGWYTCACDEMDIIDQHVVIERKCPHLSICPLMISLRFDPVNKMSIQFRMFFFSPQLTSLPFI